MKESIKEIIYYYKDYLMKKIDGDIDNINVTSNKNIVNCEKNAKHQLKKLKELSNKYKLYDENYNEFMICMGKFALSIERLYDFKIDSKCRDSIIHQFLNLHYSFEELEQINIMKDVYIWKFVN